MSIKSKVQEIAQKRWNEVKSRKGFTKEDWMDLVGSECKENDKINV